MISGFRPPGPGGADCVCTGTLVVFVCARVVPYWALRRAKLLVQLLLAALSPERVAQGGSPEAPMSAVIEARPPPCVQL